MIKTGLCQSCSVPRNYMNRRCGISVSTPQMTFFRISSVSLFEAAVVFWTARLSIR